MAKEGNGFIRIPRWAVGLLTTVFIGLLSFAIGWGMFKGRVSENTQEIHVLQKDVQSLKIMKTDLAVIRNDVGWIKKALSDETKKQNRKN